MSSTIVIQPTESLVETIVHLLERDSVDWSDVGIVFPGKRPAHFVRKALGQRCGRSFVPPRFFSMDELIDFLYRQVGTSAGTSLEPADAVELLFRVHLDIKERLGESNFTSLDAFLPVGQKLFGELEELCIANLSREEINEKLKPISYSRLNALPLYYENFYDLVAREGYSTRSMRYREVALHADASDLSEFSSMIVAGFLGLTKSEQRIFAELRRRQNVTLVYQQGYGLRRHFERLRIEGVSAESPGPSNTEIALYEAQDTHGQVFALSTLLEKRIKLGGTVNEKTVIVLPTADALFPLYHFALPLLKPEEYNIALGYPLSRTPIYGFLNCLADLIAAKQGDRFPASAYLRFILHPYTKNIRLGNRSDITRILIHTIEEAVTGDGSKMFIALEELETMDELFTSIPFALGDDSITAEQLASHLKLIHDQTIRKFGSFQSIGDFARKAIEILLFVYQESTANLHPLFRTYAETLLETIHEIDRSLLSGRRFENVEQYFNFLKRFVAMKEVPFAGTPVRGLQILGLLETRSLQFDDVYVLNVNDDSIPGSVGQEMMLPQGLREALGLETYKSRDQLVEYYFGLLMSGAKRVHLFYTETGKSEKSRLLEKTLWEWQRREDMEAAARRTHVIRYNLKLSNPAPSPIGKTPEIVKFLKSFSYSASALDTYLDCPLKFYYSKVLRLEEKDDAGEELSQQEIGRFVHSVLKRYFDPLVGRKLTATDLDASRLERIVDELFRENYGTENAGTLFLVKRQVDRQLEAFLEHYQAPLASTNDIVLDVLEETIRTSRRGFQIEGRLDRVERRAGEIFILDYKTGNNDSYLRTNFKKLDAKDRETWPKAIGSLQLPFYLLLQSSKGGMDIRTIHPAFVFLGRNNLDETIEVEFENDAGLRETNFRVMQQVIDSLLDEIVSVDFPFAPTQDLQRNCPTCPFTVMCGTQQLKNRIG